MVNGTTSQLTLSGNLTFMAGSKSFITANLTCENMVMIPSVMTGARTYVTEIVGTTITVTSNFTISLSISDCIITVISFNLLSLVAKIKCNLRKART